MVEKRGFELGVQPEGELGERKPPTPLIENQQNAPTQTELPSAGLAGQVAYPESAEAPLPNSESAQVIPVKDEPETASERVMVDILSHVHGEPEEGAMQIQDAVDGVFQLNSDLEGGEKDG